MPDETPDEIAPEAPSEEAETTKRVVRRVKEAPSPLELKKAREARLHEALLENSRQIHDDLVTWDMEEDLEVPVTVEKEFDGRMLASHYRAKGYEGCSFQAELSEDDPAYVEVEGGNGVLVFPPLNLDMLQEQPEEAPPKPPKKTSKRSSKRSSKKTGADTE